MHYDYEDWPTAPARGIRGGNSNFLLGGMFYDQEWRDDLAFYVLGPEAYTTPTGRELPSAYQIVIHATDEYDAMKRLVGNLEQWERLKELEWFSAWLERALREQVAKQTALIRKTMLAKALDGDNAAARVVLAIDKDTKKRPVGRPAGTKKPDQKAPKDDSGDAARILSFK